MVKKLGAPDHVLNKSGDVLKPNMKGASQATRLAEVGYQPLWANGAAAIHLVVATQLGF